MKINLFQVKTLFTVCLKLSLSKNILPQEDIFSYLNTTVISCYSCIRHRWGSFFSSSQLFAQVCLRVPLEYTVSFVSVFLEDYPKMFDSG